MSFRLFSAPRLGHVLPIVLVLLFSIPVRFAVHISYGPATGGDTPGYLAVAQMLRESDFTGYTAWRTPGYPFFLCLLRSRTSLVSTAQSILSLTGISLLSFVLYRLTRRPWLAASFAAFLSFSLNLLVIDTYILTESLATFLFSAIAVWIVLDAFLQSRPLRITSATGLGLLVATLVLTRPQYIALIPALSIAFLFSRPVSRTIPRLSVFLLAASTPVLVLMAFNTAHVGKPILSSTLPFNLSQHALPFIESAASDDPCHLVPEIVRLRDEYWPHAQALDDNRAFIPRPPMAPVSDEADCLLHLSLVAIRKHPAKYAGSVFKAWLRFWRVSFLYEADNLRFPCLDRWIRLFWIPFKLAWLLIGMLFVATLLSLPFKWFYKRTLDPADTLSFAILAVSVLQALVEYGDNSRYAIPMLPAMAFVVFHTVATAFRKPRLS